MKPHTAISAIYQPVLRQKLEQQGVIFITDDFIEPRDFLAELCVTSATHAIAHISVLEPRHRRELQAVRKANPQVCIIIIASVGTMKDKRLMDIFSEFNVRVVEDGSRSLVESIVNIIKETSAADVAETLATEPVSADTEPQTPAPQSRQEEPPPLPSKKPIIKTSVIKLPIIKAPTMPVKLTPARQESEPPVANTECESAPTPQPKELQTTSPVIPEPVPPPKKHKALMLPKPTASIVIPVYGGGHGAGCTWLACQIASYISQQGHSVALCGATDMLNMGPRYVRAGDSRFTIKGIDVFPYLNAGDVIRGGGGYDYIVFDVGLILEFEPDGTPLLPHVAPPCDMQEIMRAPCPIMVTDVGLWRQSMLTLMLTNRVWQDLAKKVSFASSCRAAPATAAALERQFKKQFVRLPIAEPFEMTAEVTQAVELLLQPLFK